MKKIVITTAALKDVEGIVRVRMLTWFKIYPNKQYHISLKMLEDMDLAGVKAMARMQRKVRRVGKYLHVWVAKNNGKVVGYCVVQKKLGKNHLGSLYILPTYQKRGLGGRLMSRALRWFSPAIKIDLGVAPYNQTAIKFYQKFGFKITGLDQHGPILPSGRHMPSIKMVKYPN